MTVQGLVPDIETYNALLKFQTYNKKYTSLMDAYDGTMSLLKTISTNGVTPNLRTFTNLLFSFAKMGRIRKIPLMTINVLKEMEMLNIRK
jgi:hypothetical protein